MRGSCEDASAQRRSVCLGWQPRERGRGMPVSDSMPHRLRPKPFGGEVVQLCMIYSSSHNPPLSHFTELGISVLPQQGHKIGFVIKSELLGYFDGIACWLFLRETEGCKWDLTELDARGRSLDAGHGSRRTSAPCRINFIDSCEKKNYNYNNTLMSPIIWR